MAKRGRKTKRSFVTPDGQELAGFVQDKDGRFRPAGHASPKWSGDWQVAYHKFKVWKSKQESGSALEPLTRWESGGRASYPTGPDDPDHAMWAEYFRSRIATDPKAAAVEMDYPPLAKLADFHDLEPAESITLADLGLAYLDDKKGELTPKEWANSKTWWDEFARITGAKSVADLDRTAFRKYRDEINAERKRLGRSNVWTRSRFGKIKTMIAYAVDQGDLPIKDRDRQILDDRSILKQPKKPAPRPADFKPEQLSAMLKNADKWESALILVALNAAYTNIDCQRLTWDMVNFKDLTIRFDREKSEHLTDAPLPRICALWDRTAKALKAIKNNHTHVFLSVQGQPAHIDTINDRFTKCRDKAKVNNGLTFKHLRKSALTAASNDPTVPDRQIELLGGHSAGIKEHYVVRKNVALACKAIERYYFGKGKT